MSLDLDAPPREATLPQILGHQARRRPEQPFLRTAERSLTYGEADLQVEAFAAGLQRLGVARGERVCLLMANSIEQVLVWLALNRIGAANVPLDTALTGELLSRSIRLIDPVALVVDVELLPALAEVLAPTGYGARPVLVHGPEGSAPHVEESLRVHDLAELPSSRAVKTSQVDPQSPATMLFTSGSTGVPKACVLSQHYLLRQGQIHAKYLRFAPDDVLYTPFPLFHIDGATLTVGAAMVTGATAALGRRFSASRFWDEVRACEATVFNFMGATANILWKQPPSPRDREHRVGLAWGVPIPVCEPEWQQRFGFPLVEVYGLTDAGVPAYQPLDEPRRPGSCGRVIPEYQVRIGDESGEPVPIGSVGEILIRSDEPGLLMNEYYAMSEATREALHGGWFHTGDFGRLDVEGHLYFVARREDVIRRRGENIAAADVEEALDAHPAVRESAAVGVPSELTEDDIKTFVVPQPGAALTPEDVVEHCRRVLPRHMVPRYVELVRDLPKTATEKIERFKLAALPLGSRTWDAERTGPPNSSSSREDEKP
jgi:crotonobetaine/carnitine-CoA ligase